jgi:hypothetical protein
MVRAKRYAVDLEELRVINVVRNNYPSLQPFTLGAVILATLFCGSVSRAMMYTVERLQLSVYKDLSTQNHHFPPRYLIYPQTSSLYTHLMRPRQT